MKDKVPDAGAVEDRPGARSVRRRIFTAVLIVLAAAAALYYGAVWLLIRRVASMP